MKILYLEKRGCDFSDKEKITSNVGNYRVCTPNECIKSADGNIYFLEFMLWRNRGHYRHTYKYNKNKELKNPVFEIDIPEALAVSTEYTTKDGFSFANIELEKKINSYKYTYTLENILKAVNQISVEKYDAIKFI